MDNESEIQGGAVESEGSMTPTPKLRFVERDSYSRNGEHFVMPLKIRVLQQWWEIEGVTDALHNNVLDGEWRDVPLEAEA